MTPVYTWALVALLLGGIALWRAEAVARSYLRQRQPSREERLVELRERQLAADVTERTLDEATELRKAELRRQTAEQDAASALVEALQEDKLKAERTSLHADTHARVKLAEQFAQERHERDLQRDFVGEYERYIEVADEHDLSYLAFDVFVATLQRAS